MAFNKKNKNNLTNDLLSFVNENIDVFEEDYQSRFLKVFIEDRNNWAQQIVDILFPEYFSGFHKILIDYQIEFFKKYRIAADYSELKELINDKERDGLLKDQIFGLVDKIMMMQVDHQKKDFVKQRAYSYFKSQKIKNTLIDLAIDWKSNTFDSMKIKLEDALKAGEPKNSGHDYKKDVKKRLRKDFRNPIKILPGLDEYIDGGISGGELFVVLAPTGGGKSMFLVRNGVEALNHGKNVLYFTLELSEELVGRRFDACLNAVPIRKVHDFEDLISETADSLKANIKIKHYPDGTATINTFYAHVDWLKANENFIPELIIVDYADNMKALSKGEALRHELVDIYRALRAMAIELGVPVLTASQTSGDGYSKKELELGMTAEAKSKNNIADVVVGFGRDGDQVRANEATLKILKNRNGPIGFTVPLVFDSNLLIIGAKDQKDLSHEEKQVFSGIGMVGNKNSKDTKSINKYVSNNKETSNILAILQNQQYTPEVND